MTINNEAIERADKALAIIEQFETLLEDLKSFREEIPQLYQSELDPLLQRLSSLYEVINVDASDIETLDLSVKPRKSKIERRRLSGEIIRLIEEEGLSQKEVANRVEMSPQTISKFIKQYNQAKPAEQAKSRRTSIFQTYEQFEKLAAIIYKEIARYEGMDGQVHVKYVDQLRNLIKESQQWMDRNSERQKLEEIAMTVKEILQDCTPEQSKKIAERFESIGINKSLSLSQKQIEETN